MEPEMMRAALHEAVDQIVDRYLGIGAVAQPGEGADMADVAIEVEAGEQNGPFTYRWPSGDDEAFSRSKWFRIADATQEHRALVAWTEREAWGRLRKRAVVFGMSGSSLYPWTEFVETDDGRYAAGISDPGHPRALLKDGAEVPSGFGTDTVARTDRLFSGVRQGPSLRLVVGSDDEVRMVRHGYWVAGLRDRL